MKEITVTMTRKTYKNYLTPVKEGGAGLKDKKQLIDYLNDVGNYLGIVTDIAVDDEEIRTVYTDKVTSDLIYR